jgi:hypothetical protein
MKKENYKGVSLNKLIGSIPSIVEECIKDLDLNNKDNIQFAKKLIKLLNKSRAYDYNEWIPVGWSLYNVSPTLLPDFIEFSKLK